MRICHGLAGEVLEVDSEYRRPLDVVRQYARERWNLQLEDLIVLTSSGTLLSNDSKDMPEVAEVYFFTKQCLETQVEVIADRLDPSDKSLAAFGGSEEQDDALGQRCEDVIDPAFEAFRDNIAEARARIAESRPVLALACRCEQRAELQRQAAQVVLENLKSHRDACSRSIALLVQKSNRVQLKLSDCLAQAETAIKALESVELHSSLQSSQRRSLADVVPRARILRFTEALQGEGTQLVQRLEKLQRQEGQLETMCDQVAERVAQFIAVEDLSVEASALRETQGRALRALPQLRQLVPCAGAAPATVLEEEKASKLLRERVTEACGSVTQALDRLQTCWDQRHQGFLMRLREVAYVQSKVRYVERQAALLEQEVNAQSDNSQHILRLQKMPKAYNSALREVALRRQFRERYLAQGEKARAVLARMVEAENARRRAFLTRYSAYLPNDLVSGLGAFAPSTTVEVPDFDLELPAIEAAASMREEKEAEVAAKDAFATCESRIAELEARNKSLEEQLARQAETDEA